MAVYFHNSQSGALHPSREQLREKTGAGREKVRFATQSLRKFGFLTYDNSDGGCNHRNTHHLLKQSSKVVNQTGTENVPLTGRENVPQRVSKTSTQGVSKTSTQLSLEDTSVREDREALPLPRKGEASASQEKKERATSKEAVVVPFTPSPSPECPFVITEDEKARRLEISAELKCKLRGVSGK